MNLAATKLNFLLKRFLPQCVLVELRLIRISRIATKLLGPENKINSNKIEIDITYDCNLKCLNCNRICALAPSKESMSVGQIRKFIDESLALNKKWHKIILMGGEPTLHPNIFEIINLLLEYKKKYSSHTIIQLCTNGYGEKAQEVLTKIPDEVKVLNSHKESKSHAHSDFYLAPKDLKKFRNVDYSNGCGVIEFCGTNLSPYGYYPCSPAAAMDRVFGFNMGVKTLPSDMNSMREILGTFCQYCGSFKGYKRSRNLKEELSRSWEYAFGQYKEKKPSLSRYGLWLFACLQNF